MADFSIWVTACEPALGWPAGHFLETYQNNRRGAVERAIETDLIASTIRRLMSDKAEWQGTATELLANLEKLVSKRTKKSKPWPKSPAWLSQKMKRSTTFLRALGIEIEFPTDSHKPRTISIRQVVQNGEYGGNGGKLKPRSDADPPSYSPYSPRNTLFLNDPDAPEKETPEDNEDEGDNLAWQDV